MPSDFGFHNSLRQGDGSLAFIDFEYFGWDDPVKVTADILLHPGAPLGGAQQLRFRNAAERLYGEDASFGVRLEALLPLFGLRWALILLNEFMPERWQRRVLAGAAESWAEAKARQLNKARAMLARLELREGVSDGNDSRSLEVTRTATPPLDERSKYLRRLVVRALEGRRARPYRLVDVADRDHARAVRRHPALPADEPHWRGTRPHDPEQGTRLPRALRRARRQGLHSGRDARHLLHARLDPRRPPGRPAKFPASRPRPARSAMGCRSASAWRSRRACRSATAASSSSWATARSTKARSGKRRCAPASTSCRISRVIVDYNKIQSAGPTREIQDLEPLADKWRAFNFATVEVDGHDVAALRDTLRALAADRRTGRPPSSATPSRARALPFAENRCRAGTTSRRSPPDIVANMDEALV